MALFWLGDLYTYSYPRLFGADVPFPSLGDGAYVAVYPALMAGLLMLIRRRNPEGDRAGVIDSLIMTLGLALLSWVALIAPYLHDETMTVTGKLVSVAYPLGDILLLAAAIRLAVDTGKRQPAFYLLASAIVALLVTDFAYGVVTLHGAYDGQVSLDVGWISFYLLWGAAALHPSMRELEQPAPDRVPRLTPLRLTLLTVRLAHRARSSRRRRSCAAATSTCSSSSPRPWSSSASSSCAWRASCASRSARSPASARSAPRARRSWPPPAATEIYRAALKAVRALFDHGAAARLCLRRGRRAARRRRRGRPGAARRHVARSSAATAAALLAEPRRRGRARRRSCARTCASAPSTPTPTSWASPCAATPAGLLVVAARRRPPGRCAARCRARCGRWPRRSRWRWRARR